jgi:hypothetical protein
MSATESNPPPYAEADGPRLDCFRYLMDDGVEHHVAQLEGAERIVATLRLEAARTAPLAMLRRIGVTTLPDADGAYVLYTADGDDLGLQGLALLTSAALERRRREANDSFWLSACPLALVDAALALGWRRVPAAVSAGARADADSVPLVLLADDTAHFARLGSPLAMLHGAPADATPRWAGLLEAFGVPATEAEAEAGIPRLKAG